MKYPSRNQIVIDPEAQRQDRNDPETQRNLSIKQLAVFHWYFPHSHIYSAPSVAESPFSLIRNMPNDF